MDKDPLGSTLKPGLNRRLIIKLFLRVCGEIQELVDMWQLMMSLSMKEIAQVGFLKLKLSNEYFLNGLILATPDHATLIRAECTFDRDSCAWRNSSTGDFEWRMAAVARRPANLPDKTYGAPVGYAYFDIFNTGSRYRLRECYQNLCV